MALFTTNNPRRDLAGSIKGLRDEVRSQQIPKAQIALPVREQASNASKDTMIPALQKRVKEQAAEIRELKRQLEVVNRQLAKQ